MKAFWTFLILSLAAVTAYGAETVYVVSKVAPLYASASATAAKLQSLPQGTALTVEEKATGWLRVKSEAGSGWVRTLFTGEKPSVKTAEGADSLQLTTVVTRKRASAYTSSAAATRGLSHDNIRERENLAFKDYDFQAAAWLASFQFTDEQVQAFAVREGLIR